MSRDPYSFINRFFRGVSAFFDELGDVEDNSPDSEATTVPLTIYTPKKKTGMLALGNKDDNVINPVDIVIVAMDAGVRLNVYRELYPEKRCFSVSIDSYDAACLGFEDDIGAMHYREWERDFGRKFAKGTEAFMLPPPCDGEYPYVCRMTYEHYTTSESLARWAWCSNNCEGEFRSLNGSWFFKNENDHMLFSLANK